MSDERSFMISENLIAKGNYRHSQIGNFVSVKNYIFLREKGVKRLLLRFSNELGYTVNGMSYSVFQYDAEGNLLGRLQVRHDGIQLEPLGTYATETPLAVDEKCADFKIVFSEVRSGQYRYRVADQRVSVFYEDGEALFDPEKTDPADRDEPIRRYSVKRRHFGNEKKAALITAVVILLVIALNVWNTLFFIYTNTQKKESGSRSALCYGSGKAITVNFDDGERYVEV